MFKLTPNALSPKPRWETLNLPDGQSLKLQITPPDRALWLEGRVSTTNREAGYARLQCVTDWHGVVEGIVGPDGSDGGSRELPFSEGAFTALLKSEPAMLGRVLEIINPYFTGETAVGESKPSEPPASPPPAATNTTAPATA